MMPPAGAAVGAWLGGYLADHFCARFGLRWGLRLIPIVSLPSAGALLLLGVHTSAVAIAVACFVLAYGLIEVNEGPYGAALMQVARVDSMPGWGVINTGGNLGGVVCYPILGYLSGGGDWNAAFAIGSAFCLVAAALWLFVRADQRFEPPVARAPWPEGVGRP